MPQRSCGNLPFWMGEDGLEQGPYRVKHGRRDILRRRVGSTGVGRIKGLSEPDDFSQYAR